MDAESIRDQNEAENDVSVSYFDYSVENFCASMDLIRELCGLPGGESFDAGELQRFSSMITFLKEWKYFVYEPKAIKFACEIGDGQVTDDFDVISLPQLSSAAVPKIKNLTDDARGLDSDFVLHAGGLVWAMDWCPSNLEKPDNSFKCEYLAVAAHPPDSTYHKIGAALNGRGIIQIWCLLNLEENAAVPPENQKKLKFQRTRGRPKGSFKKGQSSGLEGKVESIVPRPRGRPKGRPKEKEELTVRRPRGRPKGSGKKQPSTDLNNPCVNMEADPSGTNLVRSSNMLVPLLNSDVGGNAVATPVSHVLSNKVETLAPKRRGRPSKKQTSSLSKGSVGDENVGALPLSHDLNTALELPLPRGRGRPRKKPNPSANECAQEFCVDSGVDVSAQLSTRNQGLNGSIQSPCTIADLNGDINSSDECRDNYPLVVSREFGQSENILLSSLPDDSTSRTDPSVLKRRGRPRKQHILNMSECMPKSAVETPLITARELGVPIEKNMMAGCQMDEAVIEGSREGLKAKLIEIERVPNTCVQKQEINDGQDRDVAFNGTVYLSTLVDSVTPGNSENVVQTAGYDHRALMEVHEGFNICQSAPVYGSIKHRKKRRVKEEKARSISSMERSDSHLSTSCEYNELAIAVASTNDDHQQGEMVPTKDMADKKLCIPEDAGLPKVVFCLAHMGKVAWDVKWRPAIINNPEDKHHLGYLAVLLGNGSLEVWEVPLPSMVKVLHDSSRSDGTDPRFLRLEPIFRCSKVQCGDRQSMPLTLEWSPSVPHDLILAGCHDGTVTALQVALWKFSEQKSSQDIKPLLCFSADSVPIRSLAWAPDQSDAESANLIVTAGHGGLKFWDIRDPFRPLWKYNPVQRIILGMEWSEDPRCLIMSYDDGVLRMLSLRNLANDVLVTGEPSGTAKPPGQHSYSCSDFALWSVHVSRATGLVAYCTADGSAIYFQLTTNAVEKDISRYREPQFLCGSLAIDDGVFKIKTPQPNVPLSNIRGKKIPSGMGDAPLFSYVSDVSLARSTLFSAGDQTPLLKSIPKRRRRNKKSDTRRPPYLPSMAEEDEEAVKTTENSGGTAKRFEEFPPKEVALHKVRWNMNKGSESWLCYGGTAGLVRCQKIHGVSVLAKVTQPVCSPIQACESKEQ